MFDFLKYSKVYAAISALTITLGLLSIWQWGYIYSIDFVGGTNLEYQFETKVTEKQVSGVLAEQGVEVIALEMKPENVVFIRLPAIDEQKEQTLRQSLGQTLDADVSVIRTETVGPTIGAETLRKTAIAASIAIVGILVYIAWAFKNVNFALAAIVALFHDVLVVVGVYSIISHYFGAELDTLFVTALLTTMSFSVHDTIVVFDQIREYRKRHGIGHIEEYANKALTDTMVRSLNNSFTIIFMLLALVLLGGTTIRYFAVALLVGTVTGTYSSPFVATPVAVWLEKRSLKQKISA